jgi:hypothetical protein
VARIYRVADAHGAVGDAMVARETGEYSRLSLAQINGILSARKARLQKAIRCLGRRRVRSAPRQLSSGSISAGSHHAESPRAPPLPTSGLVPGTTAHPGPPGYSYNSLGLRCAAAACIRAALQCHADAKRVRRGPVRRAYTGHDGCFTHIIHSKWNDS